MEIIRITYNRTVINPARMDARENILMNLPEKFTRADFLDVVGTHTAYSLSHGQNLLNDAIFENQIRRVDRGVYEKCEPELEAANHA